MRIKKFIQFINESVSMGAKELSSSEIKKFYKSGLDNGTVSVTKRENISGLKDTYTYWAAFPMSAEYYFYSEGSPIPKEIKKFNTYTNKTDMMSAEQQIRNYLNILYSQGILEVYVRNENAISKDAGSNASLFDIYVTTSGTGTPAQNNELAKKRADWVRETLIKLLQEFTFNEKSSEGLFDGEGQMIKLTSATARSIVSRGKIEYIQNFNDQRYVYPEPETNLQLDRVLSIVANSWSVVEVKPVVVKPDSGKISLVVQAVADSIRGAGTDSGKLVDAIITLETLDEVQEFLDTYLKMTNTPFFDALNGDNLGGEDDQMVSQVSSHLKRLGYDHILKDVGSIFTVLNIIVQ